MTNQQRPCPLCNGTGHITGPITRPQPRTRHQPPPIIYPPQPPTLNQTLKRLQDLNTNLKTNEWWDGFGQ